MSIFLYSISILLMLLGLYCIIVKESLIKTIIGIKIMSYGICLFFILISYKIGAHAPIITENMSPETSFVDPIPHALMPAIMIIGLAAMGLMLATAIKLYEKYGTFDIDKIRQLRG